MRSLPSSILKFSIVVFMFSTTVIAMEKYPSWKSKEGHVVRFAAFGDVNADGWPDLAVIDGSLPPFDEDGRVKIFFNHSGQLEETPAYNSACGKAYLYDSLAFGDVNGDGYPELAVSFGQQGFGYFYNDNGRYDLNINWRSEDWDFSFNYGFDRRTLQLIDINGDGLDDLVAAWYHRIRIYLSVNGVLAPLATQEITWTPEPYSEHTHLVSIDLADWDGDDYPDLVVSYGPTPFVGGATGIAAFRNHGGIFDTTPFWTTDGDGTVSWADINADNRPDVVVDFTVFLTNGSSIEEVPSFSRRYTYGLWEDFDEDGFVDVAFPLKHENYIYLNHRGKFHWWPDWFSGDDRISGCLAVADVDRDGTLDVFAGNQGDGLIVYPPEKSVLYLNNSGFPPSGPSQILLAGYSQTNLTTHNGGHWEFWALTRDPRGGDDIREIDIFYRHQKTGLKLLPETVNGDLAVSRFAVDVPPSRLKAEFLFVLKARDHEGWWIENWPYLTVE